MSLDYRIRILDSRGNWISGSYTIDTGAMIVTAPDGTRFKSQIVTSITATAEMLLREWAGYSSSEF